jgi:general stress protein 26
LPGLVGKTRAARRAQQAGAGPILLGERTEEADMEEALSEQEKRAHLREVMADFDTAMLVTSAEGEMRSRPLALGHGKDDGVLYFPTSARAPKIAEIEADPRVCVTMQNNRRFVSLSGRAQVVRDLPTIEAVWSETWKVWFPEGKTDPDLALIAVTPLMAEYWDNKGTKGLGYLFESAKALFSRSRPDVRDDEQNAKVQV